MKKFFILIFLLFSLAGFSQAQSGGLPASCRKILDKNFRGWKFAKISGEIQKHLRENISPDTRGNLISGDWNGDGKTDYAALIEHGEDVLNDRMKLKRNLAVAFVRSGKTYKHSVLDTAGDYIAFEKKGAKAYDYDTQSGIRFKTDAVFVGIWEKAGRSYVWRRGKFIYFQTSD